MLMLLILITAAVMVVLIIIIIHHYHLPITLRDDSWEKIFGCARAKPAISSKTSAGRQRDISSCCCCRLSEAEEDVALPADLSLVVVDAVALPPPPPPPPPLLIISRGIRCCRDPSAIINKPLPKKIIYLIKIIKRENIENQILLNITKIKC